MGQLRIRRAGPEDRDILAGHNRAMAFETEKKALSGTASQEGVRAVLDDKSHGFYLVAERDGRVVAQLLVTFEWSDWRNGVFWWIQSVFVAPSERKKGLFRKLYQRVVDFAEEAGNVCGLRLYVHQDNQVAQEVYQALGMSRTPYQLFEIEFGKR